MTSITSSRSRWWRLLRAAAWVFAVLLVLVVARGCRAFRDRFPHYAVQINLPDTAARLDPRPLQAGFGRALINPPLREPVWLAGFRQNRAATAIHDDLWAVACVLGDGHHRVALVALDAIGFFHDDVIRVRQAVSESWNLDYVVVCSTHNHSTPDLMGLWGPNIVRTGVDPDYRDLVVKAAVDAVGQAVQSLQPARAALRQIPLTPDGLQADTRPPIVFDPDLRVMHFTSSDTGQTLGSLVNWANHPETPWSGNTEVTADFCGFLRDALEHGVTEEGRLLEPGLGGIHLYFNGAIGGLMTTSPKVEVRDPYLDTTFTEPSHDKSRALGRQLARHILRDLAGHTGEGVDHLPIGIHARTLELPLANKGYWLAGFLGLIDRGHARWGHIRSEAALLTLGDATLACIPGEIYPELVNGGIEQPEGADYPDAPPEEPPLRELMPGRIRFVMGLANDEIGYILPKGEWDVAPPHIYGRAKRPYGEINSVGPDTAPLLHEVFEELAGQAIHAEAARHASP